MLIDGHVHLEKGEYSVEWINEFISQALDRGIEEIYFLEQSSGLAINYGDKELGMNKEMLKYMKYYDVPIITASDAHYPKDVGKLIKEMSLIERVRSEKNENCNDTRTKP